MLLNRVLKMESNKRLSLAIAINASNIADYFYVNTDKETWDFVEDFPNIAPPWENIWMEWHLTEYINSELHGYYKNTDFIKYSRIGAWIQYNDMNNIKFNNNQKEIMLKTFAKEIILKEIFEKGYKYQNIKPIADKYMNTLYNKMKNDGIVNKDLQLMFDKRMAKLKENDVKWSFLARFYAEERNGKIFEFPSITQGFVTKNGKFTGGDNDGKGIMIAMDGYIEEQYKKTYSETMAAALHIPLLTISFCHCKNVILDEVNIKKGNRSDLEEKKGKAKYKYYILNIEPMKKILKYEGESDKTGIKKALHICRGHFATYTSDAPLFGRVTGTFWKPMHLRGNLKKGIVDKDYAVKI